MSIFFAVAVGFACGLAGGLPLFYSVGRSAGVAVANYKHRHVLREARSVVKAEKRSNDLLGQESNELSEEAHDILHDAQCDAEQDMIVSIVRLDCALAQFDDAATQNSSYNADHPLEHGPSCNCLECR